MAVIKEALAFASENFSLRSSCNATGLLTSCEGSESAFATDAN